jgi:hypothetical protein
MKRAWFSLLAVSAIVSTLPSLGEAQTVSLKKNQIYRVSGGPLCGFVTPRNKWLPVKKVGNQYRIIKGGSPSTRQACTALLKPSARRSLAQLPDTSAIVSESTAGGQSIRSVSGTPPTFPQLVEAGGQNYFWRSGVVDAIATGTPNAGQCNEFFSSAVDGESGGYGACYLAEGVSYSISEIASSGTTLCYMRNFPTAAVADNQLVDVISGTLPGGSVRNLFTQPSGSQPRVVKIQLAGADEEGGGPMFIRVYSEQQNTAQGNQYRFDFWACKSGENSPPQEAQQLRLSAGGELIATSINSSEGQQFTSTVRGFLVPGSEGLEFDASRGRSAVFGGGNNNPGTENNFKSRVLINGDNEIRHWLRHAMGSNSLRTGYSASRFGGEGLVSLRFYEGAFKEAISGGHAHEYGGSTEFRDTYYAAATSNSFSNETAEINFTSDDFFQEGITVPEISSSQFSCRQSADISITLDMSRESMQAVAAECEGGRVNGQIQFCQTQVIRTANERYTNVCSGQ